MTLGPGQNDRSPTDNRPGKVNIAQPAAGASNVPADDSLAGPPLRVSMHVTLGGDVWLELDDKKVSAEDARRLADVLVEVSAAAESLQRHSHRNAVTGQTEATGSKWPDDRSRDEVPRHVGQPANKPVSGPHGPMAAAPDGQVGR